MLAVEDLYRHKNKYRQEYHRSHQCIASYVADVPSLQWVPFYVTSLVVPQCILKARNFSSSQLSQHTDMECNSLPVNIHSSIAMISMYYMIKLDGKLLHQPNLINR